MPLPAAQNAGWHEKTRSVAHQKSNYRAWARRRLPAGKAYFRRWEASRRKRHLTPQMKLHSIILLIASGVRRILAREFRHPSAWRSTQLPVYVSGARIINPTPTLRTIITYSPSFSSAMADRPTGRFLEAYWREVATPGPFVSERWSLGTPYPVRTTPRQAILPAVLPSAKLSQGGAMDGLIHRYTQETKKYDRTVRICQGHDVLACSFDYISESSVGYSKNLAAIQELIQVDSGLYDDIVKHSLNAYGIGHEEREDHIGEARRINRAAERGAKLHSPTL
ncbi:hypothetical protein CC78DRAFT_621376 [Lojkania enalia]|uniref:Uncharacterized protein n=1 Tax=Lojkania enalia TaxID=147567 RepID=A0A9P4K0D0_9PLEO|nr:hypothetical protein CC78DRAFT_621376 [Didymosphaeria enalia]